MSTNHSDGIGFVENTGVPMGGTGFTGGSDKQVSASPFTKGFFFVFFAFPSHIFDSDEMTALQSSKYLLNSVVDFQPHADRQIQKIEDRSIGQNVANHIIGHQTSNEFSLTHKEFMTTPVYRIHRKWTSYIDPYFGGSTKADDFAPNEYKGQVMVIQTKPIARTNPSDFKLTDIIKVDHYDGVFPAIDPSSPFNNSVEATDRVQIPISYNFDGQPLTEVNNETLNQALTVLRNANIYGDLKEMYQRLSVSEAVKDAVNT